MGWTVDDGKLDLVGMSTNKENIGFKGRTHSFNNNAPVEGPQARLSADTIKKDPHQLRSISFVQGKSDLPSSMPFNDSHLSCLMRSYAPDNKINPAN